MKEVLEELRADAGMLCEVWLSRALDVPGMSELAELMSRKVARAALLRAIELFLDSAVRGKRTREFSELLNRAVGRSTGLGLTTSNLIRLVFLGEEAILKRLRTVRAGTTELRAQARQRIRNGIDSVVVELAGRSEDRFQDESKKLRGILDSAEVGLFRSSPDGRWGALSQAAARIMGYSTVEEAVKGSVLDMYVEAAERERMIDTLRDRLAVDGAVMRFRRADGETRWGQMYCSGVYDDQGGLVEIEGFFRDVTETAEVRDRVEAERERQHDILAGMGAGVVLLDRDRRIVWINDLVAEWFGPLEEIAGRHCYEVYCHRETICDDCEAERCFASGLTTTGQEHRGTKRNGEEVIFNVVASPMMSAGGDVEQVLEVLEDITALRHAEEKYRHLVDNSHDIVYATDENGILTFCSPQSAQYGYEPPEVVGKPFADFLHPEDVERTTREFREIMERGVHIPGYFRLRCADGSYVDVEEMGAPIYEDDRIVGTSGVIRDITERREAEEALKESEARRRLLFDQAMDAIFVAEAETGMMVDCNEAALRLTGKMRSEIVGQHQSSLHPPESIERGVSRSYERHRASESQVLEDRILTKSGELRDVAIAASPVEIQGKEYIQGIFRDVTEQRMAERALSESEKKYRAVFSQARDGFLLIAEDGEILEFNDAAHGNLGYTREEFRQLALHDIDVDESPDDVEAHMREIIREETGSFGVRHRAKNGEMRSVLVDGRVIELGGRRVFSTVWKDITERKRAEEALRESEERHRVLFESSRDAIMTLAPPSWRFTSGNPATVKMFRAKGEAEFTGLGPWEVSPELQPDGRPSEQKAKEMIEAAMREGSNFFEWTHERLDGEEFATTVLLTRMTLAGQTLLQATVRDITQRKQAEEALRESEEKWRSLVQNAPDVIFTADRAGTIRSINRTVTGLTPEQVIGTSAFEYIAPEYHDVHRECIERVFETGKPGSHELAGTGPDGTVSWYESRIGPIMREGKVVAVNIIATDVTERKQLEQRIFEQERRHYENLEREVRERTHELEEANRELRRLDEMKDQFLANVSHELRTPLVSGIGYIELLLQGGLGPITSEARRGLEISHRNLNRLVALIEDLLAFARLESGRETLVFESFDLERTIEDCVLDLRVRASKESLDIVKEIEEGLPNVYGDEDKIHRVLTNLLSNAEKFTGDRARIRIQARRVPGDRLEIAVADDGAGIPEGLHERVFERFERAQTKAPGTGIGLSLVREIVHGHNCDVEIGPVEGGGTRVAFTLPGAAAGTPPKPKRVPLRHGVEEDISERSILVIDDDEDLIQLCRKVLGSAGHRMLVATTGEAGLEIARSEKVDMVLLDVTMPGMDGVEVLRRMREEDGLRDLPIYMVSAQTADRLIKEARDAGCDGFVTKPFSVSQLLETIRSATRGR